MAEYYIPTEHSETEMIEKRSRFISQVWRVNSEEDARAHIRETRKKYYDARPHCWCYRIREEGVERYSDDGEPQGTAGQPMLNVFQRENVTNVVCVVSRYYGGIPLGAGGLVRAYTQAAKNALDAAGISVVRRWISVDVPCTYAQFETVRREVPTFSGLVANIDYGANILISALLPEEQARDFAAHILDISAGTIKVSETGEEFKDIPWRVPVEVANN